eukprot:TRINITY_DN5796_c0_g1_i1.p1 TRINITY_DN5796_c0_g1~~TRINITY_DN5796_c0_g1_i1.p1  ORF type:complete len:461 (-),score=107.82 TRINITY_DN5796_c0_g1_i1:153-1535(-)
MEGTLEYHAKDGSTQNFDISRQACSHFGFYFGDRINTPKGVATVIGVSGGFLWVHIDTDSGASYWDNGKNYHDLLAIGFSLVSNKEETPTTPTTPTIDTVASEKYGLYKMKKVLHKLKQTNIILQNENGPCPLIAICNVLLLRGLITLEGEGTLHNLITVTNLTDSITAYIYSLYVEKFEGEGGSEIQTRIQKAVELIPSLQTGMDVNCSFKDVDGFEKSEYSDVFELLGIRMVHGWLVDPEEVELSSTIGNSTYNDLTVKLVSLDEQQQPTPPSSSSETSTPSTSTAPQSPSHNANANTPIATPSSPTKTEPINPRQGFLIQDFLGSTSSQLTSYGIARLREKINEDELVVFFRNNHFSTLIKHDGALYALVTDVGFERERNIVWERLDSVEGGGSLFHNSDFQNTNNAHKEEIVNTLLLMGFSQGKIDEALNTLPKEVLSNADDAISRASQWLSTHTV